LGATPEVGLSYGTLVHLTFYVPITLWGLLVLAHYGIELSATAALGRLARAEGEEASRGGVSTTLIAAGGPAEAVGRRASDAFVRSIVEALLHADLALLPERQRGKALGETARFVEDQVSALPARLRLAFRVGLLALATEARMLTLRSYGRLSL